MTGRERERARKSWRIRRANSTFERARARARMQIQWYIILRRGLARARVKIRLVRAHGKGDRR